MSGLQKTCMNRLSLLFVPCNAVQSREKSLDSGCSCSAPAGKPELAPEKPSSLPSDVCITGRGIPPPADTESVWVLKQPSDPDPVVHQPYYLLSESATTFTGSDLSSVRKSPSAENGPSSFTSAAYSLNRGVSPRVTQPDRQLPQRLISNVRLQYGIHYGNGQMKIPAHHSIAKLILMPVWKLDVQSRLKE